MILIRAYRARYTHECRRLRSNATGRLLVFVDEASAPPAESSQHKRGKASFEGLKAFVNTTFLRNGESPRLK